VQENGAAYESAENSFGVIHKACIKNHSVINEFLLTREIKTTFYTGL
jgi:hypothetical protein